MLRCFLNRALPFILALTLGLLSWHLLRSNEATKVERKNFYRDSTGLTILSVPPMDFTPEARQTDGFSGMVRLSAAFDTDGIHPIQPVVILPDGMTYEEYVTKNHETPTFARLNGKAVNELPYGMMEAFKKSIEGIKFTPAIRDGKTHFVWLHIDIEFGLIKSHDCQGCSFIRVLITNSDDIKWNNETRVRNADGERKLKGKIRGVK